MRAGDPDQEGGIHYRGNILLLLLLLLLSPCADFCRQLLGLGPEEEGVRGAEGGEEEVLLL